MVKAFEYMGNLTRMKKAVEKVLKGEEITILFMGGSITKGEFCKGEKFSALFEKNFKNLFDHPIRYRVVNIGKSGTMSSNGIFKVNTEVKKYNPDIIFVDYSVNDTGERFLWETYEGIIRMLLELPSEPAVGILLFCNEQGFSSKGIMKKVGQFYELPMINFCEALQDEIKKGTLSWSDYALDYIHPNAEGHIWISDLLICFFENIIERKDISVYKVPIKSCFGGYMSEFQSIHKCLPLTEGEKSGELIFSGQLTFRMMIIEYMQDSVDNAASVSIEIDGNIVKYLNAYLSFAWGNPMVSFIYQNSERKEHFVEIRIAQESTREGWSFSEFICGIGLGI